MLYHPYKINKLRPIEVAFFWDNFPDKIRVFLATIYMLGEEVDEWEFSLSQ